MGSLPSRVLYQVVKTMTEIELNERIDALLSENPTQQKDGQSSRPHGREMRVHKDDRLAQSLSKLEIGDYIPITFYYVENGRVEDFFTIESEIIGFYNRCGLILFPEKYLQNILFMEKIYGSP